MAKAKLNILLYQSLNLVSVETLAASHATLEHDFPQASSSVILHHFRLLHQSLQTRQGHFASPIMTQLTPKHYSPANGTTKGKAVLSTLDTASLLC